MGYQGYKRGSTLLAISQLLISVVDGIPFQVLIRSKVTGQSSYPQKY
jgi:hypothetical protein